MGVGGQHHVPSALRLGKRPISYFTGGWASPWDRSGQVGKISPPPEFDLRTVQPVSSRYTDWAFPIHWSRLKSRNRKRRQTSEKRAKLIRKLCRKKILRSTFSTKNIKDKMCLAFQVACLSGTWDSVPSLGHPGSRLEMSPCTARCSDRRHRWLMM